MKVSEKTLKDRSERVSYLSHNTDYICTTQRAVRGRLPSSAVPTGGASVTPTRAEESGGAKCGRQKPENLNGLTIFSWIPGGAVLATQAGRIQLIHRVPTDVTV